MGEACIMQGEMRNANTDFVRNLDGMKLLGRCRHKWEDNIEMDLRYKSWVAQSVQ
jgi:hypothetical protein